MSGTIFMLFCSLITEHTPTHPAKHEPHNLLFIMSGKTKKERKTKATQYQNTSQLNLL